MIQALAFCMLILGLGPAALYVLGRIKDPLHPLILVGAASFFVSSQALLTNPEPAAQVLGTGTFTRYLTVSIVSLLGFYAGWKYSNRRDQRHFSDARVRRLPREGSMVAIAAICALIAVGVFALVYGQYTLTGYLRDWTNLWITAAILVMQVISSRVHSPYRTPAFIILAIAFIPPATLFWTYGQRGDTVRIALICSMYYLIRGTRPLKPAFIAAAITVGLTLATLAQTRAIVNEDPAQNRFTALAQVIPHYLKEKTTKYTGGEEFMFGGALVRAAADTGNFDMGKGLTLRLISRFAPKEYFADKWEWFGTSAASEFEIVRDHFGTLIPGGAAISGFAQGYFEIGWFCPVIWFILGFFNQKLWYRTLHSARRHYAGYLTAFNVAMVYAVLQDIYVAEMNMIYVLIPLYLAYRFASAPVEEDVTDYPTAEVGSPSPA